MRVDNIRQVSIQPIENLNEDEIDTLLTYLNKDVQLRSWLGMQDAPVIDPSELQITTRNWQDKNNAITYAIFAKSKVAGTISISHITNDRKARIGYWISSTNWKQGIVTQAFALALEEARSLGILQVSGEIHIENTASLHIWDRYGAQREFLHGNRIKCTIYL
jgi:RimJ/RimL family protein N-acetyltransferase